ncbi:hypothetical protein ABZ923_40095 [Streptomyces sp. NPDC046881]|uniref:hypothetical protein n=1 Tax=Streptomyces sp. NPDC046881 TaxID=3155374 RepID=UPI003406E7A9
MHTTTQLAAPGINGMQLLGAVTVTGFAAMAGVCLIAGLRGSDRIKIQNKDQALIWGFITGTLWVAAGGTWADFANGLGDVGKSATTDTGLGDPGPGGSACLLLLIAWAWPWKKRMIWPALLGLMGAVLAGQAGGIPGILVTLIRSVVAKMAGG